MAADADLTISDLDRRPELRTAVARLFAQAGPGRHHAVCGDPQRMGLPVETGDIDDCLGVLLALASDHVAGCLACCAYSDEQITLWGPICADYYDATTADRLLGALREALADSPYESLRVQVDHRNRWARSFYLRHGLSIWKDTIVFQAQLDGADLPASDPGPVHRLTGHDLGAAHDILQAAFPDSGHILRPLAQREREGYRHFGMHIDGRLAAVAAIRLQLRRAWISLIAVAPDRRDLGIGRQLLSGVMACVRQTGARAIGLEVLADNARAINAYRQVGLEPLFTATIMTGPI